MACIWEAKLIRFSENPGIRGGFTMQNPVYITWLHLSMLIDIHIPLIIPNRVPVDARYGDTIDLDSLPIRCPNNCDLRAVCGALEQKFYHKTIQPTKMSMQTITTTNPLGGTLKEPMLYSRCITLLAD